MFLLEKVVKIFPVKHGIPKFLTSSEGSHLNLKCRHFKSTPLSVSKAERGSPKGQLHLPQKQLQQLVMADTHYVQQQKKSILQMFPNVKSTVKNMFSNLSSNLDPMYRCEQMTSAVGRISHQLVFRCSFVINWPKPITFYGYGFNKKNAELVAVVKAAEMLYNDNYIGRDGYPKTVSQEERQKLLQAWNLPSSITVPTAIMDEGWDLLCQFHMEIEPMIQDIFEKSSAMMPLIQEESEDAVGFEEEAHLEQDEEMPQIPFTMKRKSQQNMDLFTGREYVGDLSDQSYRNSELLHKLRSRKSNQSRSAQEFPHLPMLNHK